MSTTITDKRIETSIAIIPGTYDPITFGHLDIIKRSSRLFAKVVVAVATNVGKRPMFSAQERVAMVNAACHEASLANVECLSFDNMLPDFVKEQNGSALVRGVRSMVDFDYEMQLTGMYRMALPQVEIVLLPSNPDYNYISSTIVRDIILHHGLLELFVPASVNEQILKLKY